MSNEQQETIEGALWNGEPLLVRDALQGAKGLFVVTGTGDEYYIFGDSKVGIWFSGRCLKDYVHSFLRGFPIPVIRAPQPAETVDVPKSLVDALEAWHQGVARYEFSMVPELNEAYKAYKEATR